MRWLSVLVAGLTCGCAPAPTPLEERIDDAVRRATAWIVEQQEADGAWRSRTYPALGDGWSLTAACAKALVFAPGDEATQRALQKALGRLASVVDEDGSISLDTAELPYPVYTAALAVIALSRAHTQQPGRWDRERDAWLRLLVTHQLTEELGWSREDPGYGGWGYCAKPPRKGTGGFEADLSSTLFALGALRLAGRDASHEAVQRARVFVERCQNLPLPGEEHGVVPPLDGGFFMTPCTDFQNKAGGSAPRSPGTLRLRSTSYGSMTCDGVRALLRCGASCEDSRVRLARGWIIERFDAKTNPGEFEPLREVERDATYYYWSWSVAHSLTEMGVHELEGTGGARRWSVELAEQLLARQRPDGSWSNPATMVKEDDPLVATPLARAALALCRLSIATEVGHVAHGRCSSRCAKPCWRRGFTRADSADRPPRLAAPVPREHALRGTRCARGRRALGGGRRAVVAGRRAAPVARPRSRAHDRRARQDRRPQRHGAGRPAGERIRTPG